MFESAASSDDILYLKGSNSFSWLWKLKMVPLKAMKL